MSNFGRAARQSTSIRSALGWRPRHRSCGHLLDCVVWNSEIRRDRLISRCQQKYQQIEQLELIFYQYFQRGSKIFLKIWNRTNGLSSCFC
jgi:hypothetical protein